MTALSVESAGNLPGDSAPIGTNYVPVKDFYIQLEGEDFTQRPCTQVELDEFLEV